MKCYFTRLLFMPLWLCFSLSLNSQTANTDLIVVASTITNAINEKGYQNIQVEAHEKTLIIYYENRVQRFEPRAIIDILQTVAANGLSENIDSVRIVTQKLQIPVLTTIFNLKAYRNWEAGKIYFEAFTKEISVEQGNATRLKNSAQSVVNTGNYRLELALKPQIGLGLGGFPDPVIHRLFLIPTFNAYLWKGAQLQIETILPITSEFQIPGEHFIRPGILSFTQSFKLPKHIWAQTSVGYFSYNRYGGRLSLGKFWLNGALALTGHIGYTGYASYPIKFGLEQAIKGWEYGDVGYLDYNVGVNYWFERWNTQVRLEYSKELFNKNQLKLTCFQRFNEVDIGFFALKTQRGNNYGMQLNIPIFPKKYWKPKRISIRPSATLNYTYQATQATVESYNTGKTILNIHRQLNPGFIKNQLSILERWTLN